jgi:hypothetical protein
MAEYLDEAHARENRGVENNLHSAYGVAHLAVDHADSRRVARRRAVRAYRSAIRGEQW